MARRTKSSLLTQIAAIIRENNTGAITPTRHASLLVDFADSVLFRDTFPLSPVNGQGLVYSSSASAYVNQAFPTIPDQVNPNNFRWVGLSSVLTAEHVWSIDNIRSAIDFYGPLSSGHPLYDHIEIYPKGVAEKNLPRKIWLTLGQLPNLATANLRISVNRLDYAISYGSSRFPTGSGFIRLSPQLTTNLTNNGWAPIELDASTVTTIASGIGDDDSSVELTIRLTLDLIDRTGSSAATETKIFTIRRHLLVNNPLFETGTGDYFQLENLPPIMSEDQARAGTLNQSRRVTPQRIGQAIDSLARDATGIPLYDSIQFYPAGIPDATYPSNLLMGFGTKITTKTVDRVQVSLKGQPILDTEDSAILTNSVNSASGGFIPITIQEAVRDTLGNNTVSTDVSAVFDITLTYDDDSTSVLRRHFLVHNSAFGRGSSFSGDYNDLTNKPTLFSGAYGDLTGRPTLFSGNYNDLNNRPTIPDPQIQADWNQTTQSALDFIKNKPTIFSGEYGDLTGRPTIPSGNELLPTDGTEDQWLRRTAAGREWAPLPNPSRDTISEEPVLDLVLSSGGTPPTGTLQVGGKIGTAFQTLVWATGAEPTQNISRYFTLSTDGTTVTALINGYVELSGILDGSISATGRTARSSVRIQAVRTRGATTTNFSVSGAQYERSGGGFDEYSQPFYEKILLQANDTIHIQVHYEGDGGNSAPTLTSAHFDIASLIILAAPDGFSGDYNDLINRPTIPSGNQLLPTDGTTDFYLKKTASGREWAALPSSTSFSGSYNDLRDKPTLFSGAYADLTGKPTIPSGNELLPTDGTTNFYLRKTASGREWAALPASTSFSGSYNDLTDKPTIPAAQIPSDWNQTDTNALDFIKNKPTLFSGAYNDLTGRPTLFSGAYNDLTGRPTLFSGSYNDLRDKPTIPDAGVSATRAKEIADASALTVFQNGVQIPARVSPGNEISGVQQYFNADFYAPNSVHGDFLRAHRNGSTFWDKLPRTGNFGILTAGEQTPVAGFTFIGYSSAPQTGNIAGQTSETIGGLFSATVRSTSDPAYNNLAQGKTYYAKPADGSGSTPKLVIVDDEIYNVGPAIDKRYYEILDADILFIDASTYEVQIIFTNGRTWIQNQALLPEAATLDEAKAGTEKEIRSFSPLLIGQAIAALSRNADGIPPFNGFSVHPLGIAGDILPDNLVLYFGPKITSKTVSRIQVQLSGQPILDSTDRAVLNSLGTHGGRVTIKFVTGTKTTIEDNITSTDTSISLDVTLTYSDATTSSFRQFIFVHDDDFQQYAENVPDAPDYTDTETAYNLIVPATSGPRTWKAAATPSGGGAPEEKLYAIFDLSNLVTQKALWEVDINDPGNMVKKGDFPVALTEIGGITQHGGGLVLIEAVFTTTPNRGYNYFFWNVDAESPASSKRISSTPIFIADTQGSIINLQSHLDKLYAMTHGGAAGTTLYEMNPTPAGGTSTMIYRAGNISNPVTFFVTVSEHGYLINPNNNIRAMVFRSISNQISSNIRNSQIPGYSSGNPTLQKAHRYKDMVISFDGVSRRFVIVNVDHPAYSDYTDQINASLVSANVTCFGITNYIPSE